MSKDLCFEVIEARERACRDGEPALWWLGVVDGLLAITKDCADGRQTTLTGMPPDVWFGEGTLAKRDVWRYDARALRRTTIAKLPIATFEWLLDRSIPFNRFIFDQVNERLGQFVEGREIDRSFDTDAKVARNLSLLFTPARVASWGKQIRITQEELASLCGLSRQRVNQALRVLEGCMFIKTTYGRIQVLDLDGLRSRLLDSQPLSSAIRSDTANRKLCHGAHQQCHQRIA